MISAGRLLPPTKMFVRFRQPAYQLAPSHVGKGVIRKLQELLVEILMNRLLRTMQCLVKVFRPLPISLFFTSKSHNQFSSVIPLALGTSFKVLVWILAAVLLFSLKKV